MNKVKYYGFLNTKNFIQHFKIMYLEQQKKEECILNKMNWNMKMNISLMKNLRNLYIITFFSESQL